MKFTVELNDAESKALGFVAVSPASWIENVVRERCRVAIEEIVAYEIERKLASGEPIVGSKNDIVISADIKSAADRQAEAEAEAARVAAEMAAQQEAQAQA